MTNGFYLRLDETWGSGHFAHGPTVLFSFAEGSGH